MGQIHLPSYRAKTLHFEPMGKSRRSKTLVTLAVIGRFTSDDPDHNDSKVSVYLVFTLLMEIYVSISGVSIRAVYIKWVYIVGVPIIGVYIRDVLITVVSIWRVYVTGCKAPMEECLRFELLVFLSWFFVWRFKHTLRFIRLLSRKL